LDLHHSKGILADELSGELAFVGIAEFVVWAMTLGIIQVFASTACFSSNIKLPGKAVRTHWADGQQLGFDLFNFPLHFADAFIFFH